MRTKPHEEFASVIVEIGGWVRIAGPDRQLLFWPGGPVGAAGFDTFMDRHLVPVHAERLLTVGAPRLLEPAGPEDTITARRGSHCRFPELAHWCRPSPPDTSMLFPSSNALTIFGFGGQRHRLDACRSRSSS